MSLLADLTAVQAFLSAHQTVQRGSALERCMAQQASGFAERVRRVGVNPTDGAVLINTLQGGPWDQTAKDVILNAIADTMALKSDRNNGRLQTMRTFENYLTEGIWTTLGGMATERRKLDDYAFFGATLGIKHASEQTVAHLTSLFHLASGGMARVNGMGPTQKLNCLRDMKAALKIANKGLMGTGRNVPSTQTYPDSPAEFQVLQPTVYNAVYRWEWPGVSKVAASELAHCTYTWPLRISQDLYTRRP